MRFCFRFVCEFDSYFLLGLIKAAQHKNQGTRVNNRIVNYLLFGDENKSTNIKCNNKQRESSNFDPFKALTKQFFDRGRKKIKVNKKSQQLGLGKVGCGGGSIWMGKHIKILNIMFEKCEKKPYLRYQQNNWMMEGPKLWYIKNNLWNSVFSLDSSDLIDFNLSATAIFSLAYQ